MGIDTLMFVFKFITHGCFLKLGIFYILMMFLSIYCVCTYVTLYAFRVMFYALFVGFMVCTMLLCSLYALFIQYFYLNAMHFPFKYCHSCAFVGLFLDAYT